MSRVQIRPAFVSDAEAMRAIVNSAYEQYLGVMQTVPAPMLANYEEIASSGDAWLAEQDGEASGVLVLRQYKDHALVENLAVSDAFQGRGTGSALLEFAERTTIASGLTVVRLYTNEAMIENLTYYPRRGYRETRRAIEEGYRRVFFEKVLSRGLTQ
jgi:N-acetylglutamate synthase-like GNAT family acetyltransferase